MVSAGAASGGLDSAQEATLLACSTKSCAAPLGHGATRTTKTGSKTTRQARRVARRFVASRVDSTSAAGAAICEDLSSTAAHAADTSDASCVAPPIARPGGHF